MEHAKIEIEIVEKTLARIEEDQQRELTDLQLTLVGGGSGEVVFA